MAFGSLHKWGIKQERKPSISAGLAPLSWVYNMYKIWTLFYLMVNSISTISGAVKLKLGFETFIASLLNATLLYTYIYD